MREVAFEVSCISCMLVDQWRHNSHCFFDVHLPCKSFHYTQRKHEWKREICTYMISIIFLEVRHTLFRSACQQLASTQKQITNLRDCSSFRTVSCQQLASTQKQITNLRDCSSFRTVSCQPLASTQKQITNLRDCSSFRTVSPLFILHSNFRKKKKWWLWKRTQSAASSFAYSSRFLHL